MLCFQIAFVTGILENGESMPEQPVVGYDVEPEPQLWIAQGPEYPRQIVISDKDVYYRFKQDLSREAYRLGWEIGSDKL